MLPLTAGPPLYRSPEQNREADGSVELYAYPKRNSTVECRDVGRQKLQRKVKSINSKQESAKKEASGKFTDGYPCRSGALEAGFWYLTIRRDTQIPAHAKLRIVSHQRGLLNWSLFIIGISNTTAHLLDASFLRYETG